MIQALTTYLATSLSLTIGTDLHGGWFPQDSNDTCSSVSDSGGQLDDESITAGQYRVQVLSRGTSYFTARARSLDIFEILHGSPNAGRTLPVVTSGEEWLVNTCIADARPQFVGISEQGVYLFSVNYTLRVQRL